jgi:ferredoxin-thioredoxin reductase catalytic subunit
MQTKMLPKIFNVLCGLFLTLAIVACNEHIPCKTCEKCGENLNYGSTLNAATIINPKVETKLDTMVVVDEAFVENKIKIEEKFGQQWDFCRCVLANDSLDRLIKKNVDLDDEFMKTFDEVDQKCKAFLVMSPNKTPEERIAHERKTKKCLKAAGRK